MLIFLQHFIYNKPLCQFFFFVNLYSFSPCPWERWECFSCLCDVTVQGILIVNKNAAMNVRESACLTFKLDSFKVAVLMGVGLVLLLQAVL